MRAQACGTVRRRPSMLENGRRVSRRLRVVREPRKVLGEFGLKVPAKVRIRVHDSNADMRYMVLPMRPAGTDGWSEERLASLVTRDSLIGVAVPVLPKKPKTRKS